MANGILTPEQEALNKRWSEEWSLPGEGPDVLDMLFGGLGESPPGSPYASTPPPVSMDLLREVLDSMKSSPPGSPYTSSILPTQGVPVPTSSPTPTPTIVPASQRQVSAPTVPSIVPTSIVPPSAGEPTISTPSTTGVLPGLEEVPTTYPPFEAPPAPKEIDIKGEIQKILGGLPGTAKELLGKEPTDIKAKFGAAPWYQKMIAGAFAGGAGVNLNEELEKTQKRIDDLYKQDLEIAKSKMSAKTQLELKQLELVMGQDKEKKEGYAKMWATMGEANPERFMNDPGWWTMGARANGVDETSLRKLVQDSYNPQTGKYEGLYRPLWEREWESKKYIATQLSKWMPGYEMNTYLGMAFGNWPDWMKKYEEKLKYDFANATDPIKKRGIAKTIQELETIKDYVSPDEFVKLNTLSQKGMIDKDTYIKLNKYLMMKSTLGSSLAKEAMELETAKEVARIKASEKTPTEATIGQTNLAATLSNPTSLVLLEMNPSYRLMRGQKELIDKFNTDFSTYDMLLQRAKATLEGDKSIKPLDPSEKQSLGMYFLYQKKLLKTRGYTKVSEIPNLNVFEAQRAIEWAVQGATPDQIAEAIIKSRQPQKK